MLIFIKKGKSAAFSYITRKTTELLKVIKEKESNWPDRFISDFTENFFSFLTKLLFFSYTN